MTFGFTQQTSEFVEHVEPHLAGNGTSARERTLEVRSGCWIVEATGQQQTELSSNKRNVVATGDAKTGLEDRAQLGPGLSAFKQFSERVEALEVVWLGLEDRLMGLDRRCLIAEDALQQRGTLREQGRFLRAVSEAAGNFADHVGEAGVGFSFVSEACERGEGFAGFGVVEEDFGSGVEGFAR